MQLKKGQIVEIDIHALAFGGAGLGKYEGPACRQAGLSVFVAGTMPGDRVKAAFTRIKNNFAEAELVEIVKNSADRITARCPYFGTCGGCQIQFMPYQKQLEFKQQQVIDAFERIGKIYDPPVMPIIGCGEEFYYRNKMEFSFGYDAEMNFALGLHLPDRRYDILDLNECHLQSEFSVRIVNSVREFMKAKGWMPFKASSGEGFLKSLFIREGKRTGEVMVNLTTSEEEPADLEEGLKEFVEVLVGLGSENADIKDASLTHQRRAQRCASIVSIYKSKIISLRGSPKIIKEKLLYGKPAISEKMIVGDDELTFDILPQAFFQVNTFQAETLYSQVLQMALSKPQNLIFDLFCGTGTIGLFLAKHAEQVLGIELNEDAVRAARENARKNNIFNIDFYVGDVSKLLSGFRGRPSLIVIDPPRAGLTEKIIDQINAFDCKEIIYVSCNPATLARDCASFSKYGYKIDKIQPVDMFPHTFHIENVCLLGR